MNYIHGTKVEKYAIFQHLSLVFILVHEIDYANVD